MDFKNLKTHRKVIKIIKRSIIGGRYPNGRGPGGDLYGPDVPLLDIYQKKHRKLTIFKF